ncbi:hypothetical protein GCM10009841_32780 [Microlunatus panaciterrae]|uniref:DivIVA domain-containing protein n=1 Tax=Microlunatus panaciterrae TaxID=400768 RepID=A0ABS2RHB1_9ACTN|nr:DivIVA domain-containing protein [Microlunatus panaciterrae]MBM7797937.1 DivIVA domain-containing protein [Microlunatus panaciterrae]
MEWVIAVVVIVALGVAAVAAAGGLGEMSREPVRDVYRQDLPDRPLTAQDLAGLRFGVSLRGYAMGQVDAILDRLAAEIADRDATIAGLRTGGDPLPASTTEVSVGPPASSTPAGADQP